MTNVLIDTVNIRLNPRHPLDFFRDVLFVEHLSSMSMVMKFILSFCEKTQFLSDFTLILAIIISGKRLYYK